MPKRMTLIHADELSGVDAAANLHKFLIRKAAADPKKKKKPEDMSYVAKAWKAIAGLFGEPIAKADHEGHAVSYAEAIAHEEASQEARELTDALWTAHWALQRSIESIMLDESVTDKRGTIIASLHEYLADLEARGILETDQVLKAAQVFEAHTESIFKAAPYGKWNKDALREAVEAIAAVVGGAPDEPAGVEPVTKKKEDPMSGNPAAAPVQAQPEVITKAAFDAQVEEIKKAHDAEIAEIKKQAEADRAQAVEAQAIAKAEKDARLVREAVAKAEKAMGYLPLAAEKLGAICKALDADEPLTVEQKADLEGVLKAASEAIAKSDLLREIGTGAKPAGNAYGKINGIAKSLREKDPALTQAAAISKACEDNQELYAEYQREKAAK